MILKSNNIQTAIYFIKKMFACIYFYFINFWLLIIKNEAENVVLLIWTTMIYKR